MLLIAHISDTHFDGGQRARERVERVVAHLVGLPRPVDAVVHTGDVADHGAPEEYAEARELFGALDTPLHLLPGNHDVRTTFRALLGDAPATGAGAEPVNQHVRLGSADLALCDSTVPADETGRRDDGWMADDTLHWLDGVARGTGPERPLFVCFHHPPVLVHSGLLDPIRMHGAERLADVLACRDGPTFLLCGHAHSPATTTFAGLPLVVAPAVVNLLRHPWERQPDILDGDLPPAIAMLVLDDENSLTSYHRTLA